MNGGMPSEILEGWYEELSGKGSSPHSPKPYKPAIGFSKPKSATSTKNTIDYLNGSTDGRDDKSEGGRFTVFSGCVMDNRLRRIDFSLPVSSQALPDLTIEY